MIWKLLLDISQNLYSKPTIFTCSLFKLSDWYSDWVWKTALYQYKILEHTKGALPISRALWLVEPIYVLFYSTWSQNPTWLNGALWLVETICMSFLFHKESKFNLIGIYENEALLQPEIIYWVFFLRNGGKSESFNRGQYDSFFI